MKTITFNSPIGKLFVSEIDNKIVEIGVLKEKTFGLTTNQTPLLEKAKMQIKQYFEGTLKEFNLPLNLIGTPFQQKVWHALTKIPYGKTFTYQEIAKEIGNLKAVRAVGGANNKNNFLIVVPCHRVIGKNGKLVGYAEGLDIKQFLLNHENKNK